MALVGYARVSSIGQSLEIQLEKLNHCDKIFQEKISATNEKRTQLIACLQYVRDGDILIISRLDRLARSTSHLCKIAEELKKKKVELKVIDQNIDTSDATGRLLFNMLGAIGQFETEIRAERQADGILKAKRQGVKFGAKFKLDETQITRLQTLRNSGVLIKELMKEFRISKSTVYYYLKKRKAN